MLHVGHPFDGAYWPSIGLATAATGAGACLAGSSVGGAGHIPSHGAIATWNNRLAGCAWREAAR